MDSTYCGARVTTVLGGNSVGRSLPVAQTSSLCHKDVRCRTVRPPSIRAFWLCRGTARRSNHEPIASGRPQLLGQVPRIVVRHQDELAVRHDANLGYPTVCRAKAAPRVRAQRQRAADKIADQIPMAYKHVARVATHRAFEIPAIRPIRLVFPARHRLHRYRRTFSQRGRQARNALAQKTRSPQGKAPMFSGDDLCGLDGSLHGAAVNRGSGHVAYPPRRVGRLHLADTGQPFGGVLPVSDEKESPASLAHRRAMVPIPNRNRSPRKTVEGHVCVGRSRSRLHTGFWFSLPWRLCWGEGPPSSASRAWSP